MTTTSPVSAQAAPVPVSGHLRVVGGDRTIDPVAAERAIRDLLVALGHNPRSPRFRDTSHRVAALYREMLTPDPFDLTTFANDGRYDELVVARDISFRSVCAHHLLPFEGVAHIGYLPGGRILGLSKLARLVDFFARDLQVQQRLTKQIADSLQVHLAPRGIGVVVEANHCCSAFTGARPSGPRTITSAVRGALRHDIRTRQEFFALAGLSQ